jgi:hypothetical protein
VSKRSPVHPNDWALASELPPSRSGHREHTRRRGIFPRVGQGPRARGVCAVGWRSRRDGAIWLRRKATRSSRTGGCPKPDLYEEIPDTMCCCVTTHRTRAPMCFGAVGPR